MHYMTLLYNYTLVLLQSEVHDKPSLLSVNPGLIIWTIIIFLLLLLLLSKIAWKPMLGALNSREESIKSAIENAEKLKEEAELLIQENKKNIQEAQIQSSKIINEARDIANKVREDIMAKANEDSKRMTEEAKAEITRQKDSALNDLRNEVADLAINAAEKIIKENLNDAKQKQIVNDFLNQVPASKN